jgi:hypothetical protein
MRYPDDQWEFELPDAFGGTSERRETSMAHTALARGEDV